MTNCLYCYNPLPQDASDFHPACSKKMFGTDTPPYFPYKEDELSSLASEIIRRSTTVTGVQPKLSLDIKKNNSDEKTSRLTMVGLWGSYILKPPSDIYPSMPEVEDLTMHLAGLCGIKTVPHSLIRMSSGSLAYITRRIDRTKNSKLHMEDMCQLTERLTADKYYGSYEQIAKVIRRYSTAPGLDLVRFYEIVLFSFLTGNSDMHLKNFSLLWQSPAEIILSPAYDLIAAALVNPADKEDLALTLNGKKQKITRKDFTIAFTRAELTEKQQSNIFLTMERARQRWEETINKSFLSLPFKERYSALITERFNRLL